MMHIRGKRERLDNSHKTAKDRRGRPLKPEGQLAHSKKAEVLRKLRNHHMHITHKMQNTRDRLSTLEKLPIEIVQQIFFHALEVNLPRASQHLGEVLSTKQIFNALIVFAYFDDDGRNPVEKRHFLPAEYRKLSCAEKIRLQITILTCKWCTHKRIRSCLPSLSRLAMVQAWYEEHALDESHGLVQGSNVPCEAVPTVANELLAKFATLPNLGNDEQLERHYLARELVGNPGSSNSIPQEQGRYNPCIITWTSQRHDQSGEIHKSTDKYVSVLATRHIADWLLCTKPWTEERLEFLQLLRQGYTFIQDDHVMSISARAVFRGMRNAIEERNLNALTTLLELHNVFFKSGAWGIQHMLATQLTPASHYPLPLDLFYLAIRQGDSSTALMSLLLRAGIDSLPQDDEAITAWAVHQSQQGNDLASWLLKHMEGTANYGLPRRGYLFVDGCLSWRVRDRSSFPFPQGQNSFAQDLGYISGTAIVPAGIDDRICGFDEEI